jgi:hypothetical protein
MTSRSIVRFVSTAVAAGCVFLPQYARAADAPDMTAAPPTTDAAKPAAAPPQADTPKPISEAPPAGPAKERSAKNAIYVEGLGAGLFYSVNYERVIGDFSPRIGFSYVSVSAGGTNAAGTSGGSASATFLAVPITVSYLGIGSLNNIFELGAGATILSLGAGASSFNHDSSSSASGSAVLVWPEVLAGYRYQPADGGFFFKGGIDALIGGSIPVLPWPYVSLGGTF